MTNKPIVCICIPNYNNEITISETLDSIINQTYKNIIIKIFDNASTDKSMDILMEYERRYSNIKVYQNDKNIGGEANFTKCIENMEGDYSAIYHSDDIYMPTIIEEEVKTLENNNISAVFTNAFFIDKNGDNIGEQKIPKEFQNNTNYIEISFERLFKSNLKNGNFLVCPTAMSSTKTYKDSIQNWDGHIYKTATDIDIWLRFSKINNIGLINKNMIKYRLSLNSFSYRRLKNRITPRDIFLVLDNYIQRDDIKKILVKNDYNNYNYTKFMDAVIVQRNKIINNIKFKNDLIIFNINIIKKSFSSVYNIKYFIAAVIFKIINLFR